MSLTKGAWAALITVLVGALCLFLEPHVDWLGKWPAGWTLPVNDWISQGLGAALGILKPVARFFAWLLAFPMDGLTWLLSQSPWPLTIASVTALGWRLGGWKMALLGAVGFGFVLISGYWLQSMRTLALVFVSVPLALLMGLAIGILAYEVPRVKSGVNVVLDVMQTVPTFAYLTPLLFLFGFGPVVGLVASAIYAAPPMARNTLLGLERVEHDIREAAIMSGGTRRQQLFLVEIPAAANQIMIGVNQSLMAALSMVIIAAVIGGFDDIGWEVLLTMRKAWFGQAFLAGLVIVVFAIVIDRMSATLATQRKAFDLRISGAIVGIGAILSFIVNPDSTSYAMMGGVAASVDTAVGTFTANNGAALDSFKNGAMFYGLLPLRIGLDQAVLPFTWGFMWQPQYSLWLFGVAIALGAVLAIKGRVAQGIVLIIAVGILETGIADLPWPFVLIGVGALGWMGGGWKLARLITILLGTILLAGLWERALLSLYLSGASVFACAVVGGLLGLWAALSKTAWAIIRPMCDVLQTIPLFVFLIPVLMFFQIGEFSAFLAICMYAVVPMIRYTRHGLISTPPDMVEAAVSSGATRWQMLREVRAPYAAPSILLGLNQTILYAFAMLVIAALIGTTGLGQSIYLALGQADIGMGISAGAAMAILAFIADRLVQGFAEDRRKALGL